MRLNEQLNTHRDREKLEDYSKVIQKLKKLSVANDKGIRNQAHKLDGENVFMMNPVNRGYSRKSQ